MSPRTTRCITPPPGRAAPAGAIARPAQRADHRCARRARGADRDGPLARQAAQVLDDLGAVARDQDLLIGRQKKLDPLPRIRNQAGAGAGSLKDARRRGKADRRHAVPCDVEHGQRGRVESIVVARRHVAEPQEVLRCRLAVPAIAAEQEARPGQSPCRLEEEGVYPRPARRRAGRGRRMRALENLFVEHTPTPLVLTTTSKRRACASTSASPPASGSNTTTSHQSGGSMSACS